MNIESTFPLSQGVYDKYALTWNVKFNSSMITSGTGSATSSRHAMAHNSIVSNYKLLWNTLKTYCTTAFVSMKLFKPQNMFIQASFFTCFSTELEKIIQWLIYLVHFHLLPFIKNVYF